MSDTVNVAIGDTWGLVSDVAGYASPGKSCQFCVNVGVPSESLSGHRVNVDGLRFEPAAGEGLYFRADKGQKFTAVFTGG